ncbi:NTP transferase domain-containing protein [Lutibacter sp.]
MGNDTVFVLLAGGKSERMGIDKGLLKYQHTFWILEQLLRISKTTISEVFIGLGYNYQHYFTAIPWFKNALSKSITFHGLNVKVVINKHPELGSFATLQSVLKAIKSSSYILLNPIDVPILNTSELEQIIDTQNLVVIPTYNKERGHPVKLHSSLWKQLINVAIKSNDARLDYQLRKLPTKNISFIKVNDCSIIKNLNTKPEWVSFLNKK